MTDNIFKEVEHTTASLDNHVEELHRAILGAQRLIRAYDRVAHGIIAAWTSPDYPIATMEVAVQELQRVYERRQV